MLFPTSPSIERPINQRQQVRLKLRYKKTTTYLALSLSLSLVCLKKPKTKFFEIQLSFPSHRPLVWNSNNNNNNIFIGPSPTTVGTGWLLWSVPMRPLLLTKRYLLLDKVYLEAAQLSERLLLITEICGSDPVIDKTWNLVNFVRPGITYLNKNSYESKAEK